MEPVRLEDSSGFFTASYPLPRTHWSRGHHMPPPMPLRLGEDDPRRPEFERAVQEAARYAYKASTMCGNAPLDPDALVQNMIVGLLGYHTPDGLGSDPWQNPSNFLDLLGPAQP